MTNMTSIPRPHNYAGAPLRLWMPALCLIIATLLWTNTATAQESRRSLMPATPAPIDTAKLLSDQPLKSPWGALLRSAILPGWGQFYNERYVKGVLVLSANAWLVSRIIHNHNRWEETRDRSFFNRRNDFYWYFGVAYLLNLADAYVDAYLFGFDEAMQIGVSPPPLGATGAMLSLQIRL